MEQKKTKSSVLVWDSGVGGLSILRELVERLPSEDYVYFADIHNAPYGGKSVVQMRERVLPQMRTMIRACNPKCVVLACNTATATIIEDLRREYPNLDIVGTEPALKPAIKLGKEILLMSTPATYKNCALVREFANQRNVNMSKVVDVRLSSVVERNFGNTEYLRRYMRGLLANYVGREIVVVLGCTHYVLIRDIIQSVLGEKAILLDSTQGVCNRVKEKLCANRENEGNTTNGSVDIIGNEITKKIWNYIRGN